MVTTVSTETQPLQGSMGLPLLGETLAFIKSPFGFIDDRVARSGPAFKTHVLMDGALGHPPDGARRADLSTQFMQAFTTLLLRHYDWELPYRRTGLWTAMGLLASLLGASAGWAQEPAAVAEPQFLTPEGMDAHRPRFSPDGRHIAFQAGDPADIYVMNADGSDMRALTEDPADDREPDWLPDGNGVVFASNRDLDYDLWQVGLGGGRPSRLFDSTEDEREPTLSSLEYAYRALINNDCNAEGGTLEDVDRYLKVAYTRVSSTREIWFSSLDGQHQGRISPEGEICQTPSWSGDGLSLSWDCEAVSHSVVFDAQAQWDRSIREAMAALNAGHENFPPPIYFWLWEITWHNLCDVDLPDPPTSWRDDRCLAQLPRRYAVYPGNAVSDDGDGLHAASYSANQTVIVAAGPDGARYRERDDASQWQSLSAPAGAQALDWSPQGDALAWEEASSGAGRIALARTDFYLQDVRDLFDYPELFGSGASPRLHQNDFVARTGETLEYFAVYEQVRYQRRSPFVSADAILQLFHDEVSGFLIEAEAEAQSTLELLSRNLFNYYTAQYAATGSESDRYLAVYFGVPALVLEAAEAARQPEVADEYESFERVMAFCQRFASEAQPDEWEVRRYAENECDHLLNMGPPEDRFSTALAAGLAAVSNPELAEGIGSHLAAIAAHAELGTLDVPGLAEPVDMDWTQFAVRGNYVGSERMGYFMAVMWYGLAPLPANDSSFALVQHMDEAMFTLDWQAVDTLIGTLMGRPVDATLSHLSTVREEHPELLSPFQAEAVAAELARLRGPVDVHGISGTEEVGDYPLRITFIPRRLGLDVEAFAHLTHPDVALRGMPSPLDVMGVLGVARARDIMLAREAAEEHFEAYRAALEVETGRIASLGPGYFATDLYHSWLAALAALATPEVLPEGSRLSFAQSPAWSDRLLLTALAGYTELKHETVLYSYQDYSAECDGPTPVLAFIEMPLLPEPRPFVDPVPTFFEALDALATRTYDALHGGVGPDMWADYYAYNPGFPALQAAFPNADEDRLSFNTQLAARHLAQIARLELVGDPVPEASLAWLREIGVLLEGARIGAMAGDEALEVSGARGQNGVAIVVDVHNNLTRQETLELAVGRISDLYVVVPDDVGSRMTQGGMFSFYEFTQPMGERLTDQAWNEMLRSGAAPALPDWAASFLESAPAP